MATFLEKLTLNELSLVDKGANQHARVSIFKRDSSEEEDKAGSSGNQPDGENMSDENVTKMADLEKSVADLTARLEKAEAEKVAAEALAKMTDVEKAHYDGLDEKAKAEFVAKSDGDRAKIVKKASEADESVELSGRTIKKSVVGEDTFFVLKAQAEDIRKANEEVKKARDEAEMATLRKRADDEFKNVLGTVDERAELLKYLNGAPEAVKTHAFSILKSANASEAFVTKGTKDAKTADVKKSFNDKVSEIAKRDNINEAQAMAKVAMEFPELVTQE